MPHLPEGSVPLSDVIKVLEVLAQAGAFTARFSGDRLTLVKDGTPEVLILRNPVGRRMVQMIAHKYANGRVEYFYHPDMVVGGNGTQH